MGDKDISIIWGNLGKSTKKTELLVEDLGYSC